MGPTSSKLSSRKSKPNSFGINQENTKTVILDNVRFLGVSIVYDTGIYVRSVIENGAVAMDGRIHPGDRILKVNDKQMKCFNVSGAIDTLKKAVYRERQKQTKIVVAKPKPDTGM